MNIFLKLATTIYKTYDDKWLDIPYFRAMSTFVFCLFLHIVQVALLFDIASNYFMPGNYRNGFVGWIEWVV